MIVRTQRSYWFDKQFTDLINKYNHINLFKTERTKNIVFQRLGINQDRPFKIKEIAIIHGVSYDRIRQIYFKAWVEVQRRIMQYEELDKKTG